MENTGFVRSREGIRDAHDELNDLAPGSRLAVRPVCQRSAGRQFRNQILVTLELAGVVDDDDVWMAE
jgi:hypothetical protein